MSNLDDIFDFSAIQKPGGRKSRHQNLYQNRSSLSNSKGLKLDILVRNCALKMQRERDRFGSWEEEEEEEEDEDGDLTTPTPLASQ